MNKILAAILVLTGCHPVFAAAVDKRMVTGTQFPGISSSVNYFKNSSFEENNLGTAVTAGSLSAVTTNKISGRGSLNYTSSGSNAVVKLTINTDNAWLSQNCQVSFKYVDGGAANLQYKIRDVGNSVDVFPYITLKGAASISDYKIENNNVPCPNPNTGGASYELWILIPTASTVLIADDFYFGLQTNIGSVQITTDKANTLTFTFTNWGTVSNNNLWWRRVGDQMIVEGTVTPGTTVASVWSLNLPSGYEIDASKMSNVAQKVGYMERVGSTSNNFASSAFGPFPLFWDGSTTTAIYYTTSSGSSDFSKANGNSYNSGDKAFISFAIPIKGWTASGSAVRSDQTDFGSTAFTPTSPNSSFGTITSPSCFYSRVSENMNISCTLTVGAMLNSEARITIPGGWTIKSTFTGLREVGSASVGNTGANTVKVLANAANNSYLTFGIGNAGNASLSSALGTAIVSNSTAFSFTASVPIEGWSVSQKAPILVGGVSTSSSGNERIERATMTCANSGSTISNQSGAFSVSNGGGAGTCTASITSGFYAATPTCSCTLSGSSASGTTGLFGCSFSSMSSTSLAIERYRNGAFENGTVNVICVGPRL